MSYQSIKKLYRSGNIAAAKAALVEALKNNTLTAVEKKSVIRLNSEPLLEAYVAFMPSEPKKWEIMEIVHTGNVKIIDSLEVAEFPVAAQQELLKLNDVGIFRRHFKRYPKVKFCNRVDVFIIRSGDRKFAAAYLAANWLDREVEEVLLDSNDLYLIRNYFGKYEEYGEILERLQTE